MDSQFLRYLLLIVFLMLAVFIASTGGIQNPRWSDFFAGLAISILATIFSLYFLQDIYKKSSIDYSEITRSVYEGISLTNKSHFGLVDRNMDIGKEFWINLIDDLDTTIEPVWFLGHKLSWWLKTGTYKTPLRKKFLGRITAMLVKFKNQKQSRSYMTYVFLSDRNAVQEWIEFFQDMIDEITKFEKPENQKQLQELFWTKIVVAYLSPELVKYSLVLCGDNCSVMMYTCLGGSDDSPTLEIKKDSIVRTLFINDLKLLKTKAESPLSKFEHS